MLDKQTPSAEINRFEALCAEIGEYDHLPNLGQEQMHPAMMLTGQDHEVDLDAKILAGLVSP